MMPEQHYVFFNESLLIGVVTTVLIFPLCADYYTAFTNQGELYGNCPDEIQRRFFQVHPSWERFSKRADSEFRAGLSWRRYCI